MFVLVLLAGCESKDGIGFSGTQTSPYFPMDGDRTALYYNENPEVAWTLHVEKQEPTQLVDGMEVVNFEYSNDTDGTILGIVQWSSTTGEGIKIHGYSEGTGDIVPFVPPINVSDPTDYMNRNDVVTTETDQGTFTSEFVGFENCPVQWGIDNWDCLNLVLDDGDGDASAGRFFVGSYWLVTRYGPAWMQLTGYDEKWNLADYDWSGEGS